MAIKPLYEPNPKHKEPWHHGKSGTLCPRWTWDIAQEILEESDLIGSARYGIRDGMAFKGREHAPGKWHGYPIAWNEVPPKLVNQWIRTERITRREVRSLWGNESLEQRLRGGSR
ncbi:MAG: hypothetical protein LGR52_10115 [Candidatus Thiosymbion ectosymbiont of Robbea hypermnestra]|nr:hypothetical protein [Candidatus Thiosymbion ectosymbiont of Robbea hypermnestra]